MSSLEEYHNGTIPQHRYRGTTTEELPRHRFQGTAKECQIVPYQSSTEEPSGGTTKSLLRNYCKMLKRYRTRVLWRNHRNITPKELVKNVRTVPYQNSTEELP